MATFEQNLLNQVEIIKHLLDQLPDDVTAHNLDKAIKAGQAQQQELANAKGEYLKLEEDYRVEIVKLKKKIETLKKKIKAMK